MVGATARRRALSPSTARPEVGFTEMRESQDLVTRRERAVDRPIILVYRLPCIIDNRSADEMIDAVGALPAPSFRALSQHAAHALREAILTGRYQPGDRLVERELAAEMQISRAPVREALWLLSNEGLVTLTPHRGAVVAAVSSALVIDVFSVRTALEGMAARLAATHLRPHALARLGRLIDEMEDAGRLGDAKLLVDQDIEFHRVLAAASERPVLLAALEAVWNKTSLLIGASRTVYPLAQLGALHAPILEAARAGDPGRMETAVREHLAFGEQTLLNHLDGRTDR